MDCQHCDGLFRHTLPVRDEQPSHFLTATAAASDWPRKRPCARRPCLWRGQARGRVLHAGLSAHLRTAGHDRAAVQLLWAARALPGGLGRSGGRGCWKQSPISADCSERSIACSGRAGLWPASRPMASAPGIGYASLSKVGSVIAARDNSRQLAVSITCCSSAGFSITQVGTGPVNAATWMAST